jgi:phenylpropionate dioxygenase-like ring-hydroxylating dioxygenase large terminal subunit
MGMLDHWHPMLPSRSLRKKPVGVRLAGRDIALFRTRSGQVGALDDACPHRRMRLSRGQVSGERLICSYHGWSFDCAGNGESPGTPKLTACASTWDACEKYGYVWVKSKQSQPKMPELDTAGWCWMCNTEHFADAPLEITMDNFCEIEHTPMVHQMFGYKLDRMRDVTVRFETTDDSVTVINHGAAKMFNFFLRWLIGLKRGWNFNDTWTTYFSPCYSVYDHSWYNPINGKEAWVKWRVFVFFIPIDDKHTRVSALTYANSKWPVWPDGGLWVFRGLMRRKVIREIEQDVSILKGLSSLDPSLEGMKLSRFDKALGLNRERIERIYRGNTPPAERQLKIAAGE